MMDTSEWRALRRFLDERERDPDDEPVARERPEEEYGDNPDRDDELAARAAIDEEGVGDGE